APAGSRPSLLRLNLAAISVLLRRDLKRFFRQRSRVAGALIQPLIFWLVIGGGLAGSFRIPGAPEVGYVQYFYPGIIVLVVLLTSVALASLGFALAWWLNSTQGYHVVMSVLLIPLWVLSGAMFPPETAHGGLATLAMFNPVAYSVAGIRRGLYGAQLPSHL